MTGDDLIASLVRDLEPVAPLSPARVRARRWGLLALVVGGLAVAMIGIRADIARAVTTLAFQAHVALVLLAMITAAAAAFALSEPGEPVSRWRVWTPVLAVVSWVVWLTAELGLGVASGSGPMWITGDGWGCVAKVLTVALTPGVVLVAMLRRGAVVNARPAVAFAGLAAAGVGALGAELACPKTGALHLLVWHAGPAAALAATAALIGGPLLIMWMRHQMRRGQYGQ